jgi:serine O-acetyltransferase
MLRQVVHDAIEMTRACALPVSLHNIARSVFLTDSFPVMVMTRAREAARRYHIPLLNRTLRKVQMAMYGVEVGRDVELDAGVYFVHTLGTVVGGTSRLGKRVRLMGANTIGSAKDNGCPVIEDDVEIGCGARVLGAVHIGRGAKIGANAVVLCDVPAGATAVGVPARIRLPGHAAAQARPSQAPPRKKAVGESEG